MTIANSTISGNTADLGTGGIYNGNNSTLTVLNSTISGNTGNIGGLTSDGSSTANIVGSTISGNAASASAGAVHNIGAAITVTNSTISNNSAVNEAGGIDVISGGTFTLANTVLAGNTAPLNPDIDGAFTDNGGNQVGVSINLAPLSSYGGATQSMIPQPGSPAICAGTSANATAVNLTTDQRGFVFNPNCPSGSVDAGAVQSNYAIAFTVNPPSPSYPNQSMRPSPRVGLTESGNLATFAAGAVTVADSDSILIGTETTNFISGVAIFGNLTTSTSSASDTLQAALSLNPNLSPALALTTLSNSFQVAGATAATLTSPTPGTQFTSANATFAWTGGVGVEDYELYVGDTSVGSANVYNSGPTLATSENVTIPTTGATLYVRLRQMIGGVWQNADYTYTEFPTPTPATITTPAANSTLTSGSVTFTWTGGMAVQDYDLTIGTTGIGASNVYDSLVTQSTSETVTVPTTGAPLYVRLRQRIQGAWQATDYVYTESGTVTAATITTPASGSTLTGASATFIWTGGSGVQDYVLLIGTTGAGSYDVYDSGIITATTETVTVPTIGDPLYVRLRQRIGGVWQQADYMYTQSGSVTPATITSPGAGSTLTGSSVTFTWTGGVGVQDYDLTIGATGVGSSGVYDSGVTHATSETVTVPTTGGTLYVRLRQRINGAWQEADYTYIEQ